MSGSPQLQDAFADLESRIVRTIGVVDVNGSTEMKELQSESGWLPGLGWLYRTITDIVLGSISDATIKYIGDGAMFACDPDHTTAAVNAVIRIQEALKTAGTRVDGAKGIIDFTCSAALTTGEVRRFTTPNGTPDFVGSVVDKAFRLCAFANAKAIFVDTATVGAANVMNIKSVYGEATNRLPGEYTGEVQKAVLKGFAQAVAYQEILWDQQLYAVASAAVTASTDRLRPTPAATPRQTALAAAAPASTRPDRRRGEVTHWNVDKNCGVVHDPQTGEDFYTSTRLMVYAEDAGKMTPGREVVFLVTGTAEGTRKRQAAALLLVGEPAEGPLVSRPAAKQHGWIRVEDTAGNRHLVYVAAADLAEHRVGTMLGFIVSANDKGACASHVERAQEDAA